MNAVWLEVLQHPACSPDLLPCNFHIFGLKEDCQRPYIYIICRSDMQETVVVA